LKFLVANPSPSMNKEGIKIFDGGCRISYKTI
jgi:hypothetical protein